jgi:RNA polymerase sigma-70 factor (ECF subfamily)
MVAPSRERRIRNRFGLSLVEMAEEMEVPPWTIKRRLHTAGRRSKAEPEASASAAEEWTDGLAPGSQADDEDDVECVGAGMSAAGW